MSVTNYLLAAIPLVALIIPLLLGRFPGEQVIERLVERATARPRAERRPEAPTPRHAAIPSLLRARLLMAASFAKRPPPGLLATS